jgi:hypothetical protein
MPLWPMQTVRVDMVERKEGNIGVATIKDND